MKAIFKKYSPCKSYKYLTIISFSSLQLQLTIFLLKPISYILTMANTNSAAFAVGFIFLNLVAHCYGNLQYGFYNGKCKTSDVETIVRNAVISKFFKDPTIAPALIRMQFHDCFVNVSMIMLHAYILIFYFHACKLKCYFGFLYALKGV